MSKKKHWSKKLKEENAKLLSDIYAILDGNVQIATQYRTARKMHQDLMYVAWYGNRHAKDNVQFDGIFSVIKKAEE